MLDFGTLLVLAFAGIVQIWILQTLIDVFITSRVMDDPVNGKILATIAAYVLACLLLLLVRNTGLGVLGYIPGALLIGWLQYRKALNIRGKMSDEDVSSTFE